MRIALSRPLISFSFDDFPKSALLNGGAILRRYGFAGTYYASLGLMGQLAPTGRLFEEPDLHELLDQGHELGCHTFAHCHAWDTRASVFEQSIIQNRRALRECLPGREFTSFAYPISTPRPATKRIVARYFACSRAGGQTVNSGTIDLNQLSAFFLEKSRDRMQVIKDVITRNADVCGWLILATHDVSKQPTPFGCTPSLFEEAVRLAAHSGARVLPVGAALSALREPAPRTTAAEPPKG